MRLIYEDIETARPHGCRVGDGFPDGEVPAISRRDQDGILAELLRVQERNGARREGFLIEGGIYDHQSGRANLRGRREHLSPCLLVQLRLIGDPEEGRFRVGRGCLVSFEQQLDGGCDHDRLPGTGRRGERDGLQVTVARFPRRLPQPPRKLDHAVRLELFQQQFHRFRSVLIRKFRR